MAEWIVEIGDGNPHIKKMIPLVRCKDCKHISCSERTLEFTKQSGICGYWEDYTELDGFCYKGEKVTE